MTKAEFTEALATKLAADHPSKTRDQCRRLAEAVWRQYTMHGFAE